MIITGMSQCNVLLCSVFERLITVITEELADERGKASISSASDNMVFKQFLYALKGLSRV